MPLYRLAIVAVVVGLLLSDCAAPLPTPVQVRSSPAAVATATPQVPMGSLGAAAPTASSTAAELPSISAVLPARVPPPAAPPAAEPTFTTALPAKPGPVLGAPFRAWALAPGGDFYLLTSAGTLNQGTPDLAKWFTPSAPLFGGRDPGQSFLAVNDSLLVVSSTVLTQTLVLEPGSFALRGEINRAGPVGLDGSQRLFVLAGDAVWAYSVADLKTPPVPVTKWPVDPFTPRPRNLTVDTAGRQLLVTMHDVSASPPHQQEWYAAYDLDSLEPLRTFPAQLGELSRASIGGEAIVGGMAAKNGFLGSKVAVFDGQGRELRAAKPMDGHPVVDGRGEWIYLLRERGIWVLRASDMSLVAMSPSVGNAAQDLLLSPDTSKLYVVGDGTVEVKETARLRSEGIADLLGPIPPSWSDNAQAEFFRARFYPAPGSPNTAYLDVGGYGETWRSEDRGATWRLLAGLIFPNFHYATHLSISPDFARDRTLVAVAFSSPTYLRSTDGGDTWIAWEPPVAFVSERDGNREIYTTDRGKLGSGPAQNLVRRTNDAAADENPAWSPGWTRIALQSNQKGNWDIFTIRADCGPAVAPTACDPQQLTDDPADDMLPAWSPDGKWIAFVSTRDGSAQIYLVPAGGGSAQRITASAHGVWRPAWLPDSQRLRYTASRSDGSNDIVEGRIIEQGDGRVLMGEGYPVANSPADERDAAVGREFVVYLSDEGGYPRTYGRYNYDAASSFPFTAGAEPEGHPTVLGDGTNTLLLTLVRDGQTGIYRASSSGYEPFVVDASFNGQPAAGPVPWQPATDWSKERLEAWQR